MRILCVTALMLLVATGAMAQSLTGSYVAPLDPLELCADTDYTFMFDVWNASGDAEWVDLVEVTFPPGMAIVAGSGGYSNPAWVFNFIVTGQTASWVDGDGGYGEIYGMEGGQFWCDANSGDLSGGSTFDWHISGDDWGSPPHDVYGSFDIPTGSTATEATTWGAVKALLD